MAKVREEVCLDFMAFYMNVASLKLDCLKRGQPALWLKKRIQSIFVCEKTPYLSHLSVLNPGGDFFFFPAAAYWPVWPGQSTVTVGRALYRSI